MSAEAADIPAKAYGCSSKWLASYSRDRKKRAEQVEGSELAFIPNNPAMRAPIPIPIVPIET